MEPASAKLDRRRRTQGRLAAHLAALSDDELAALVAEPEPARPNIHGNRWSVIEVDGAQVFVKKIALTDRERADGNEGSTANLFGLPLFYQYGVGSAGFGAWRELCACLRASGWALSGRCPHFPLVYHWRVLPRTPTTLTPELAARLQRGLDHWERSEAIGARLDALMAASASVVVFLEHVPETLAAWLARSAAEGLDAACEAAIVGIHEQWRAAAAFMNERGLLHFDLHRQNVLTDGEQIYVADFGLAICADFDLSPPERGFFETHRLYDRGYVDWAFTEWLRRADPPPALTPALEARLDRLAPVATVFAGFIDTLSQVSKTTPYPAAELEAALGANETRSLR
jgi:hypothetical protein